jgi:hypothetical protein
MNHIILPTDAQDRKKFPIGTTIKEYFPNAIAAVAYRSWEGNNQHHPDKSLHWDMSKSSDEIDCMARHTMEEDYDGAVWRALALYEREFKKGWRPKWWKKEWDNNETRPEPNEDDLPREPLSFEEWKDKNFTINGSLIGDNWWYESNSGGAFLYERSMPNLYQEYVKTNAKENGRVPPGDES